MIGRLSLVLFLVTCMGCASKPQPKVKIRHHDATPPAAVPAQAPPTQPVVAATKADGDLPAMGAPITTREAMEKAVSWAVEGLTFYEHGELDSARKSFSDARLILLEADLPDFWKEQGLASLQSGLPENLRHHDLAAVARQLEQAERPDATELAERAVIETEVRRILRQFGDLTPQQQYVNVLVYEVQRYVQFYRGKYRPFFERSYLRKHKYWPTIQEVLAANKLPGELGYIAFVESGFSPKAVSRADAHGLWQFIPETGKRYGLLQREDFYDVRKSTQAAAGYLMDLLNIFGSPSFLLAAASYNAGEGKIMRCLRDLDSLENRSFWAIRHCLALETQEYVPKIMAAAVISSDPKRFGFYLPTEEEMQKRYEIVVVPQVMPLARISEMSGVDVVDLRLANNDLDPNLVTTPGRNFPLYLPIGAGTRFMAALSAQPQPEILVASTTTLPEIAPEPAAEKKKSDRTWSEGRTYVVKGGDTLSSIARRHELEAKELAKLNKIRSPYTLSIGQRLVLPPGSGESPRIVYTVQDGNSIEEIADMFSVRDRDIMSWNELRSSKLKEGQTLHIFPSRGYKARTYKVQRGDSLAAIARRFGVSLDALLTANGLSTKKVLRPGQKLVVYVPA